MLAYVLQLPYKDKLAVSELPQSVLVWDPKAISRQNFFNNNDVEVDPTKSVPTSMLFLCMCRASAWAPTSAGEARRFELCEECAAMPRLVDVLHLSSQKPAFARSNFLLRYMMKRFESLRFDGPATRHRHRPGV